MNQQQKYIIGLQKKSKERRKEKAFVVEGRKMFEEIPVNRLMMTVVSESFEKSREGRSIIADMKYSAVSDDIFESLSDTKTPQGILAVVKQKEYSIEDLIKTGEKAPLILVLEHIQDPGNMGTMFRAAEAAGVTGILLDGRCVDVYNPKTIRSTMGSLFRVPFCITEDITRAVEYLKKQGISCYAAHLEASGDYDEYDYKKGTAFFIGNEANGLSDACAALADNKIKIPMHGKVESLNAAMAATVLMFEASRQRRI